MGHRDRGKVLLAVGAMLATAVLAVVWTIGNSPSAAQPSSLLHCPQAGKWAISVWSGDDNTDIQQALATCGEGAVAGAYYIDPHTQMWTSWFATYPQVSDLLTLNAGQGIMTLGGGAPATSNSDNEVPGPTPGGMLGCPQPDKWAISVWAGASGTSTGQAVTDCTGAPVAAAWWIDPQTQAWKGYFGGRPEISDLLTLEAMQGMIALGGEPGIAPPPAESPPSTPTESPAATTPGANPTATPEENPTATPGVGIATPTTVPGPVPARQLTLVVPPTVHAGDTVQLSIRLEGDPATFAAFNFDVVYDQTLVSLGPPQPALDALNTADRSFQCDLPPPSGDVDPDPRVGRARLVCFSFGGPQASAPSSPLTIATIQLVALSAGTATLTFDNVALFTPDATANAVAPQAASIQID